MKGHGFSRASEQANASGFSRCGKASPSAAEAALLWLPVARLKPCPSKALFNPIKGCVYSGKKAMF